MIQRIQHVFLLLAAILNAAFFFTPLFERAAEDPASWISSGIAAGLAISTILNLIIIFMYRHRNVQLMWLKRAFLFQILALGFCAGILFSMGGISINLWDEGLSALLPGMALLFMVFAMIYIRKDEQLVRSIDRLR